MEDIEHTELDMIELYDDQQKEWRFHDEQGSAYNFFAQNKIEILSFPFLFSRQIKVVNKQIMQSRHMSRFLYF